MLENKPGPSLKGGEVAEWSKLSLRSSTWSETKYIKRKVFSDDEK